MSKNDAVIPRFGQASVIRTRKYTMIFGCPLLVESNHILHCRGGLPFSYRLI